MNSYYMARLCNSNGVWAVLERLPRRRSLIVLNYHRIGDAHNQPYDPGVFTATREEFSDQVDFLERRYDILNLDQAIQVVTDGPWPKRSAVLITFDDGYRDNFDEAFPILAKRGVPATFFLVSSMVGSSKPMWWDSLAWIVKNSRRRQFRLEYPSELVIDLDAIPVETAVRQVLHMFRIADQIDLDRYLEQLEAACDRPRPESGDRLFLGWDEAAKMLAGGMSIGSHSHTHRIMSRLSPRSQCEEALVSRQILSERLGCEIDAFAYPVGRQSAFSPVTMNAVRDAGYQIAFSFFGGVNRAGPINRFDLLRLDVSVTRRLTQFRSRMAVAAALGR
jgi:peptidoglycan/xylan/chitin deacetylase (PgdA/CDA1 family)